MCGIGGRQIRIEVLYYVSLQVVKVFRVVDERVFVIEVRDQKGQQNLQYVAKREKKKNKFPNIYTIYFYALSNSFF